MKKVTIVTGTPVRTVLSIRGKKGRVLTKNKSAWLRVRKMNYSGHPTCLVNVEFKIQGLRVYVHLPAGTLEYANHLRHVMLERAWNDSFIKNYRKPKRVPQKDHERAIRLWLANNQQYKIWSKERDKLYKGSKPRRKITSIGTTIANNKTMLRTMINEKSPMLPRIFCIAGHDVQGMARMM